MKVLVVGDVHFCTTSSIVRNRGTLFSARLENLINTLNWVENEAVRNNVNAVIYAGDFFDKSVLTAEELTALNHIKWADKTHYVLVGNHDAAVADLTYTTSNALLSIPNFTVISDPIRYEVGYSTDILFLPYSTDKDRIPLSQLMQNDDADRCIVISHNDIANINYGAFLSKNGYDVEELSKNFKLVLNGHIHNYGVFGSRKNVINIGNITGQNFSEDGFNYNHCITIVDCNTFDITRIENPFAYYFYKIDINNIVDTNKLSTLRDYSVVTIKCREDLLDAVRAVIRDSKKIVASRTIIVPVNKSDNQVETVSINQIDHIQQFVEYMRSLYGNNDILEQELTEVCR